MRAITTPSRLAWGLSGLVTAVALAVPGTHLITRAGTPGPAEQDVVTRTVTVSDPVTSLTVDSSGDPVQVVAGSVRRVQIAETFMYNSQDGPPEVAQQASHGRLTLTDPCASYDCTASFAVTVPPGVTVTVASEGGAVMLSGVAGANVDSSGGSAGATAIDGPLTVSTGGGPLLLNGLTGALRADTGGGNLFAQNVAAATATVTTGGGDARVAFSAVPDTVMVSTDGGLAYLAVPGGPYALTANSDSGPELVSIATDPAASRSITVSTGGGLLQIDPGR
jgi:hypothetical protein